MNVADQPAYVLHTRAWRESSLLMDVFTEHYGRVSLVARGVRNRKKQTSGQYQPFREILVSWKGKGDLYTLCGLEETGVPVLLSGKALYSGMYLNELLTRMLVQEDPHMDLYELYRLTLQALASGDNIEKVLRMFEKNIVGMAGYQLNLEYDQVNDAGVQPGRQYLYRVDTGPVELTDEHVQAESYPGSSLLSLARDELDNAEVLADAKRLMRKVIAWHIGDKPLKSRQLFSAM